MRGALLVCSPLRSISCPFVETGSRRFRFRSIIRDHEVSPSVSQSGRSLNSGGVAASRSSPRINSSIRLCRTLRLVPIGLSSLLQPLLTPPLAQRDVVAARSHQRIMTARPSAPSPCFALLLSSSSPILLLLLPSAAAVSCLAERDLSKHDIRSREEEEEDVARP